MFSAVFQRKTLAVSWCFVLTLMFVAGCGGGEPGPTTPPGMSIEDTANIGAPPSGGKKAQKAE